MLSTLGVFDRSVSSPKAMVSRFHAPRQRTRRSHGFDDRQISFDRFLKKLKGKETYSAFEKIRGIRRRGKKQRGPSLPEPTRGGNFTMDFSLVVFAAFPAIGGWSVYRDPVKKPSRKGERDIISC
jgi:hypothetical protein